MKQEKDPLHYKPNSLLNQLSDPSSEKSGKKARIFGKLVTTSGGRPGGRPSRRVLDEEDPSSDYGGEEEGFEYINISTHTGCQCHQFVFF